MELEQIEAAKEEVIDVAVTFDDDGKPTSGFKIVGANSDRYRQASQGWRQRMLNRNARRGRAIDLKTEEGANEHIISLVGRDVSIAMAITVSIYGFTENKVPIERSDVVLQKIFKARPQWVDKIIEAAEAERGFTQPSSAS